IEDLAPRLIASFGDGPQTVMAVPGEPSDMSEIRAAELPAWAARLEPTLGDTRAAVYAAASDALARNSGPVLVLTDHSLDLHDDRLLVLAPRTPLRNAGIVRFAAREMPTPQAMVSIRNDTPATHATIRLRVDGNIAQESPIDLPAGAQRDYFF